LFRSLVSAEFSFQNAGSLIATRGEQLKSMSTRIATQSVRFHVPFLGEEEIRAVTETLESGWITTGPKTHCFEEAFARFIGVRHALAVSSCTAALHLSLEASRLREGDEVLVPTLTFAATGEVVAYFKAKPVLVDVDPVHFNLSLEDARRKITPKTRVIIPVHFGGHPCFMDSILDLAAANGLTVVEDAAHALPAKYRGQSIGTLSPLTAFSFYATKTLTTGEGGMVTTNDCSLADRIALMRLHGMSRDAWKRYTAEGTWRYEITEAGYKYNLTDPQAALGLVQLSKCEAMWQRRVAIAQKYDKALASLEAYRTPKVAEDVQNAWHLYVILVKPSTLRIHRDRVMEELRQRGIGTSVHFIPLHLHPYYQRTWGYRPGEFPVAEDYFDRCISLPIYPGMTDDDLHGVIEALHDISHRFRR
jgi:perosamine synthetase